MRRFLIQSFLILFALGGCADDRDLIDFERSQLDERLAIYESVEGVYAGEVFSLQDDSLMGALSIELSPDTRLLDDQGVARTRQRAVLRGNLQFLGEVKASANFEKSYYDEDRGIFRTSIIFDDDNVEREISVLGRIKGDSMIGSLQAFGYPEFGGEFELSRSQDFPQARGAEIYKSVPEQDDILREYVAEGVEWRASSNVRTVDALLILQQNMRSAERDLYEMFFPVKKVQVTLTLSFSSSYELPIYFEEVDWDRRVNKLKGTTLVNYGSGGTTPFNLVCEEPIDRPQNGEFFDCIITSGLRGAVSRARFRLKGEPDG